MQDKSATTLFFLLLGFGLLQMGNALQGTLLAVRGDIENFDSLVIGALTSAFYIGMCLGSLYCDKVIRQAGHIRTFAAMASLGSAAALGHLLLIEPISWITLRFITGFCFAGLIIVVESWLNASSTSETRGRVLSMYFISSMGAGIVGQLMFTTADPTNFVLFVLVSIAMSVALVPISLSKATAPLQDEDQESPSLKRLWSFSPFGAIAMLMLGMSVGSLFGLAPVYAQRLGLNQGQIGVMMAALMLGGVLFQYPVGMLSDKLNRRGMSITLAIITIGICSYLVVMPLNFLTLLISMAILGGMALPNSSLVIAHVNDRAPATALVAVSSALLLMYGLGAVIGPLIGGYFMETYSERALPLFMMAGQALLAIWGIGRMLLVDDVDKSLKTAHTAAPISPVVAELEMGAYEDAIEETELS